MIYGRRKIKKLGRLENRGKTNNSHLLYSDGNN